ncbi:RDD family protein [Luteirhabdus pelagi]|uniref:RDD family protein n=1 Tax=Luteirhabdus pelagi TaxID=2792783 RepID=UPI00193954FC|nr:RDD family protein [Luteirhabdus pelagi]
MDNFQIETAQNVNLVQNVAGVGERILAYLVDGLILFVYIIGVSFLLSNINTFDMGWLAAMSIGLPIFLYHLLWETFWNGQTPGKAVLKIRVVMLDGSKPAFSNYMLRWLLRLVDISLSSGGVAVVVILFNGKGQRLGDIAAKTTVISEKKTISFKQTVLADIPDDYVPTYPQVTVFSDAEMQTIKNLYQQARFKGQHNVILKLSDRISSVMDVSFETKPVVFVDTVIKDYSFYTQQA